MKSKSLYGTPDSSQNDLAAICCDNDVSIHRTNQKIRKTKMSQASNGRKNNKDKGFFLRAFAWWCCDVAYRRPFALLVRLLLWWRRM